MTETKWTPGPWCASNGKLIRVSAIRPDGKVVCVAGVHCIGARGGPKYGDPLANAHLIAAAPTHDRRLLESTELLERLMDEEAVNESDRPEIAVQIQYNRVTLAKARGES